MIRSGAAVEALENTFAIFRPDLGAFVVNRDKNFAFAIVYGDRYGRAGRRILRCVVDELHDGGAQQLAVSISGAALIGNGNPGWMAIQLIRMLRKNVVNELWNQDGFLAQLGLRGFQLGGLQ